MILQLAVSTFMVLLTVVIHGGGLAILGRMLRGEVQVERCLLYTSPSPRDS